jgi:hypothetical protein
MADRWIVRLAWASWWFSLVCLAGLIAFSVANNGNDPYRAAHSTGEVLLTLCVGVLLFQGMATVGLLITRREPHNVVGWLFCATPLLMMFGNVASGYGEYAQNTNPGVLPAGVVAGWLGWTWLAGLTLFATFVGLVFPDGRLPGRRWRPVAWLGAVSLTCLWLGMFLGGGRLDAPLDRYRAPAGIPGVRYLELAVIAIPVLFALGVASMVVRYRRGGAVERAQLRWVVAAVVVNAVYLVLSTIVESVWRQLPDAVFLGVLALIPAAIGIAILRYRLYEIDVIIRKTLVYGGVLAGLGAVYLSVVALVGLLFQSLSGRSDALAVTISTLVVVAAFHPVRRRAQRAVDRRFYRSRYDARRAAETFSEHLRREADLEAVTGELVGVVERTLRPVHCSIWLSRGE